jgi:hypothetical protein
MKGNRVLYEKIYGLILHYGKVEEFIVVVKQMYQEYVFYSQDRLKVHLALLWVSVN